MDMEKLKKKPATLHIWELLSVSCSLTESRLRAWAFCESIWLLVLSFLSGCQVGPLRGSRVGLRGQRGAGRRRRGGDELSDMIQERFKEGFKAG